MLLFIKYYLLLIIKFYFINNFNKIFTLFLKFLNNKVNNKINNKLNNIYNNYYNNVKNLDIKLK